MFLSAYEVNEPVSIAGAFTENVKWIWYMTFKL